MVSLFCALGVQAQQDQTASDGNAANSSAVAAVPRLIKYSGVVRDARAEPLGNVAVRLTFAVYSEQQGGVALWAEPQVAQLDEQGHYTVLLGATRADGLPVELFPAGKARWLGVQVEGRDEDLRVLLVSVPYALKAEDAAMLGGRQASDFVLGEQLKEEVRTQVAAQTPGIATQAVEMLVSNPPKAPAIAQGPSTFTCATTGDCVGITQGGTGRALRTTAFSASEAVFVQQNGTGYGLRALSPGNVALYGQITSSAGTSYGVKGQTTSSTGAGVFGYNLATTGVAYGVIGQTKSVGGYAIWGRALATSGATIGVVGTVDSTSGIGIMGQAMATSGTTTGIVGRVVSPEGTALVVDNTAGGKLVSAQVNGVEKFSVSSTGNVSSSGSVIAGSFVGNGAGLTSVTADKANDLNCALCITPLHVSFNYAGSSSQGGPATAALTADTATNALSLGGMGAANYARTDSANTFTETQTFSGNLNLPATAWSGAGVVNSGGSRSIHGYGSNGTVGVINLGGSPFIHAYGTNNTFVGVDAGNFTTTGSGGSTGIGFGALYTNTTGDFNTALGYQALYNNTNGHENTAIGYHALANNTSGYRNTAVGISSGSGNATGDDNTFLGYNAHAVGEALTNATAIGAHAVVSQSNSLVLGGGSTWAVNVGIGESGPSNILTIKQGSDTDPIADAWTTYSSRRWKTNIQTLQDALDKVARLRGVSYDSKADGQHNIGLIAEEVGEVVPEVVAYEANGQDAKSVDYARLTALLIEAVKEQQAQIHTLKSEIERLTARLEGGVETASR